MRKPKPVAPSTISDKAWASLRRRAAKADPDAASLTSPRAIAARLRAGEQLKKSRWS